MDKTENFDIIQKFDAVINYIESNFVDVVSEYGIIIADILSKFRKNNENLRNWVLKFMLDCDNIEYMEIAANI